NPGRLDSWQCGMRCSLCLRGQGEGEGDWHLSGAWRFTWRGALFSFAQSSPLHRQFASALVCGGFLPPHPSPLPEERENRTLRFRRSRAPRLLAARDAVFPLPEGQGEEEGGWKSAY